MATEGLFLILGAPSDSAASATTATMTSAAAPAPASITLSPFSTSLPPLATQAAAYGGRNATGAVASSSSTVSFLPALNLSPRGSGPPPLAARTSPTRRSAPQDILGSRGGGGPAGGGASTSAYCTPRRMENNTANGGVAAYGDPSSWAPTPRPRTSTSSASPRAGRQLVGPGGALGGDPYAPFAVRGVSLAWLKSLASHALRAGVPEDATTAQVVSCPNYSPAAGPSTISCKCRLLSVHPSEAFIHQAVIIASSLL